MVIVFLFFTGIGFLTSTQATIAFYKNFQITDIFSLFWLLLFSAVLGYMISNVYAGKKARYQVEILPTEIVIKHKNRSTVTKIPHTGIKAVLFRDFSYIHTSLNTIITHHLLIIKILEKESCWSLKSTDDRKEMIRLLKQFHYPIS